MQHVPVMLETVLALLAPKKGEAVLDVTLGLGGHASAFLRAVGAEGFLVGLDADPANLAAAGNILPSDNSLLLHTNFSALPDVLPDDRRFFDIIFADLGLSSPHIDDPARGFTFRSDAPLDMRFDQTRGESAERVLQTADPITLRRIFREFGELTRVPAFVDAIVQRRGTESRIRTSNDLRATAEEVYGFRASKMLPQIFQSLRISVNDEIGSLQHLLRVAPTLLSPGGRFGVLSYHSLEDRCVKEAFRSLVTPEKDVVTGAPMSDPPWELLTKKPCKAPDTEIAKNPRARSAVFRAMRRRIV